MCFAPQRRALVRNSTSQPPKVVRTWCVLYSFTWKCASRHNGVHFFETRHLSLQKWSEPLVFWTFWLGNVLRLTTACTFSTSQRPKVVRTWCVLYIFTWKCISRHNGVHFFDISTSKSGPDLVCFVHFHLEMCFAPQRRALFRHLNFQKWSGPGVYCTFWLGNVLRATTACTFSTSQLPKVVRTWCVLCILTWKCASRHNGVHFFISHLASWLRTRRFSEPTFRPSGATNHWKNTVNRDVPTFSRICIFFLLTLSLLIFFLLIFSLLTLLTSAFQLSILSEVSLLNFLRLIIFIRCYIGEWPQELMRCLKGMSPSHSPSDIYAESKELRNPFLDSPDIPWPWHPHTGLKKWAHEVQTLLPKALSELVTSYNLIAVCARIAKLDTQQLHASIVPKVYHDRNSMIGLAKFNPVMKCDECKDHKIQTRLKVLSQISVSTSKVSKQMCPSRKHRKLHACLTRAVECYWDWQSICYCWCCQQASSGHSS